MFVPIEIFYIIVPLVALHWLIRKYFHKKHGYKKTDALLIGQTYLVELEEDEGLIEVTLLEQHGPFCRVITKCGYEWTTVFNKLSVIK